MVGSWVFALHRRFRCDDWRRGSADVDNTQKRRTMYYVERLFSSRRCKSSRLAVSSMSYCREAWPSNRASGHSPSLRLQCLICPGTMPSLVSGEGLGHHILFELSILLLERTDKIKISKQLSWHNFAHPIRFFRIKINCPDLNGLQVSKFFVIKSNKVFLPFWLCVLKPIK